MTVTCQAYAAAYLGKEYAPGVKLICGAYHPPETTSYIGLSRDDVHLINQNSLVYSSKAGTDTCSNTCVLIMVHTIMDDVRSSFVQTPRLGILFGSWNTQSAEPIAGEAADRADKNKSVLGESGVVRKKKEAVEMIWKKPVGGVGGVVSFW